MATAIIAVVQFYLITWLWWIPKHLCHSGNVFNFGCNCKV